MLSADPATPAQEARPLARRALESELGPRILRDAGSARPWWRRIAALRVLTRSGDERAPELLRRALFSGHKPLAGAAAALLAQDASRRAAEVLVEGLISDVYSSSRLATALEQNGSPVGDLLRPRLRDSDSRLRYWAAYLAARWPRADGLDAELAALVTDPDPLVRKAAIQSLASLGGPLVEGAAARLRNDPIDFVRTHAVRALESGR